MDSPKRVDADAAALDARVQALARELRCPVCSNQSVAESDTALAQDLRRALRERLQHGDSDAHALAALAARFGEQVLYRPPLKAGTLLLWGGPALLLLGGAVGLAVWARRRQRRADPAPAETITSRASRWSSTDFGATTRPSHRLLATLAVLALCFTAAGYAWLGSPAELGRWTQAAAPAGIAQQFTARLRERPYDPDLLSDYADLLAATSASRLEGEPARLIERALAADPRHVKSLTLAGTLAFDRRDDAGALRLWQRALDAAPRDHPFAALLHEAMEVARKRSFASEALAGSQQPIGDPPPAP